MKNKKLFFTLFVSLCLSYAQAQVIATQFGSVQGTMNGPVHEFLGIPFAKPPVDSLRWKAPRNPDFWMDTLNTTLYAPKCPQKSYDQGDTTYTMEGDEDCLYLNVWTPQTGSGNRPVLVFIHGGGNQQGSAREYTGGANIYKGKSMAERGNAVVVTIQYRLGPLGFLVHPGLEQENTNGKAGNYAVLDQILALKWVKNNISNFGGDTSKIMIFGESAGGVNVGNLLVSPLAAGLFHRACIQSAVPVVNDYTDSKNKGIAFVDSFTTTGTDAQKIAYMRSLDADSLLAGLSSPLEGGIVQMNWQPSLDNYVFTTYPEQAFQSGVYNKVPVIIGSNSEEMSLSAPMQVTTGMVNGPFGLINLTVPAPYQAQANTLYPATNTAQAKESYIGILSDAQFTATARRTARCISQNQTEPVWRYLFSHRHAVPSFANALGAYHGIELFYVFNTIDSASVTILNSAAQQLKDDSVKTAVLNYWVNFANTGNPNGSGLVNWPQYQSAPDCYLEIKPTPIGTQCGLRTDKCDLWDDVISYAGCTTSVGLNEALQKNSVLVYPNPTNGIVYLDVQDNGAFNVTVTEFTGKKIIFADNIHQIDISRFAQGIYLITVEQGNKLYQTKIVKQ